MPKHSRIDKSLNRSVGKALHSYDMISEGDRLLVGFSGGKDSQALMWILKDRLSRMPFKYKIFALYVDSGFKNDYSENLDKYCREMEYDLRIEHTDYGILGHSSQNRENPCFLCSLLRRKRFFEIADELGCNKLALGHTKDDIIETLFLNMWYSGKMSTMNPVQPLFNGKITIIRPLAFVDEELIKKFVKEKKIPDFINTCPSANNSKRHEIKLFLKQLFKSNKKIKNNIFSAIKHMDQKHIL